MENNKLDSSGCLLTIIAVCVIGLSMKGCDAIDAYTEKTKAETQKIQHHGK